MGCVEYSEILNYKIDGTQLIEPFGVAYERVAGLCESATQGASEYLDVSGLNISVADSSSETGYSKVRKFIKNHNVENWRTVNLSDGYCLTATGDHPLPVIGKGRVCVDDLMEGDKVAVAKSSKVDSGKKLTTKYFSDDAWLLGVLLAKASYSESLSIKLSRYDTDVLDRIVESVEKLGYKAKVKESLIGTEVDHVDISITGISKSKQARAELASLFGTYTKRDRYISSEILTSDRKSRLKLLAGLLDVNGHTLNYKDDTKPGSKAAYFVLTSANKSLAMTEMALIRGLGLSAKMARNRYSSRHKKISYMLAFEVTSELLRYIGSMESADKAMYNTSLDLGGLEELEVTSVTQGCRENEVSDFSYDVETESDRFDVSFIQSHNCRTRVIGNVYDPDNEIVTGRGNLSFTSINLPRLAIEASGRIVGAGNMEDFYSRLDEMLELVHKQLLHRFEVQCRKHPRNYPFLMGQGIWIGSDKLGPDDDIRSILRNGSLSVGFIGLAETLKMLTGKHHGESEESQKLGLEIVKHMRDTLDRWSKEEHYNFTLLGTPAEGLSGRFVKMDVKKYGKIPGVTDRDYYTNSSHVPVYFNISAFDKIHIEAPYHALENAGHICYVELDGDPTKNLDAFEMVIRCMHDANVGYGAINHPVDRDPVCGYTGIIGDVCPRCGRREGQAMTPEVWMKIKGYAEAGSASTCGTCGNPAEESDRIPNYVDILTITGDK